VALEATKIAMCIELLLISYKLFLERTDLRIAFIEQCLKIPIESTHISEDERRNLPNLYEANFSTGCLPYVEKLHSDAMEKMRNLSYDQSSDILNGLMFIQEVVATALWKYHCDVGQFLESFARQFDRLDLPVERQWLYDQALAT
jgi:hypothetical protein